MARRNVIWIDGAAGATVGVIVLLARQWMSDLYKLPLDLVLLMGVANLAYALYSLSLATRARRPLSYIYMLVIANSTWACLCMRWATIHADTASVFGLAHLVGEGLFVGGLASLEWRWRQELV